MSVSNLYTDLNVSAAYNEDFRTTLGDKRLQELLLKIDGAPNREQVRHICLQEQQQLVVLDFEALWQVCVQSTFVQNDSTHS
jgi:hypothetical protein